MANPGDIEDQDGEKARRVVSEPLPTSSGFSNDNVGSPSIVQANMTLDLRQSSEKIVVNALSAGRTPSFEQIARQRFISKFRMKMNEHDPVMMEMPTGLTDNSKHKRFTIGNQIRATLLKSWLNLLLLAVPAGFVVYYMDANPIAVFFVNFAAILPLNSIFTLAIDEVRLRTSPIGGILIYMSLG